MISSQRLHKAESEGYLAHLATNGNPHLTKNEYYRYSAQWKAFNKGWNKRAREVRKEKERTQQIIQQFKFLERCYETT